MASTANIQLGARPARRGRKTTRPMPATEVALPDFIRLGRAICGDLDQAASREWWLSNGLGGYAAGTVATALTRRYHGLLIAPVQPPLGRSLLFAKADATVHDGARRWPLFTNRWAGGAVEPRGHEQIEWFRMDGTMPVWRFAIDDLRIEARIWMEQGANTTYVAWRLDPETMIEPRPLTLSVALTVNGRDHHGESAPWAFDPAVTANRDRLVIADGDRFALSLVAVGGEVQARRQWIENFDLAVERERGLNDRDHHLCVGEAVLALEPGRWVGIVASTSNDPDPDLDRALARRRGHDAAVLNRVGASAKAMPDWIRQLVLAADSFVFARPLPSMADGQSVIAGYPWFGDWGRDTMIALVGLTLVTGRDETARRILETFARFVDRGMLPNLFPGAGDAPDYNTVDAALWYFEAWRAYVAATGDEAALARAFPVLEDMISWHRTGTRYGIRSDPADGLLFAGEPGIQLTWMDAKLGDWVVTPRIGKPVEINALWFNALKIMEQFAQRLGLDSARYRLMADAVAQAFERFVKPDRSGLFDVIDGPAGADGSVRPNQIFAVSLPHSPLAPDDQAAVVAECARSLLASYGLRSLALDNPDYRAHYLGDVWQRDGSYHQGPVWAWLLGHYALAEYRVTGNAVAAQARLEPIRDHLTDAGLGTVSEIFDGAPPHRPRGCPSQAWSVACVLEAWWRLERAKSGATTY